MPLQQTVVPQGHRVESRGRLGGTPAAERQGVELSALARAAAGVGGRSGLDDRSSCDVWSHKEDDDGNNSRANDRGDAVAWDGAKDEEVVLGLLPCVCGVLHEIA
jgi:hypothetical protein